MLGIVVPYWNPFGDRIRLENLGRCLAQLRTAADVRVICVEMDCGSRSEFADIVLAGEPDSIYIWQKERLANYGCALLADEGIDYFGYVDADCFFVNPHWARTIVTEFERGCNIVQGFSRATAGVNSVPSAMASFPKLVDRLHGGSMFLHRDLFLRIGGLYEHCVVGGGDFVLMMAVTGNFASMGWVFPSDAYRKHAAEWLDRFRSAEVHPGCADNAVTILTHGNPQRSHRMRHKLLQDFDPEADIIQSDTLRLTEIGKRLLPRLRAYSAHREDRADIIRHADTAGS